MKKFLKKISYVAHWKSELFEDFTLSGSFEEFWFLNKAGKLYSSCIDCFDGNVKSERFSNNKLKKAILEEQFWDHGRRTSCCTTLPNKNTSKLSPSKGVSS